MTERATNFVRVENSAREYTIRRGISRRKALRKIVRKLGSPNRTENVDDQVATFFELHDKKVAMLGAEAYLTLQLRANDPKLIPVTESEVSEMEPNKQYLYSILKHRSPTITRIVNRLTQDGYSTQESLAGLTEFEIGDMRTIGNKSQPIIIAMRNVARAQADYTALKS